LLIIADAFVDVTLGSADEEEVRADLPKDDLAIAAWVLMGMNLLGGGEFESFIKASCTSNISIWSLYSIEQ